MANTPSPQPWDFIIEARLRAGYGTATAAAKALGLGVSHYCQVEKGYAGLGGDKLIRAARLFNVDVMELRASQPARPPRRASKLAAA